MQTTSIAFNCSKNQACISVQGAAPSGYIYVSFFHLDDRSNDVLVALKEDLATQFAYFDLHDLVKQTDHCGLRVWGV